MLYMPKPDFTQQCLEKIDDTCPQTSAQIPLISTLKKSRPSVFPLEALHNTKWLVNSF